MTRRAAIFMGVFAVPAATAAKKDKSRKREPLGVISGTVFDAEGRSLPGAKVLVHDAANPKVRFEAFTNNRGEFSVRAPAEEDLSTSRKYTIRAEAKGFEPGEKTVEVYQAQRTNANLLLDPKK
jgi:hypothetical protein